MAIATKGKGRTYKSLRDLCAPLAMARYPANVIRMAIHHHSRYWIQRSRGHSSLASAAYISGSRLVDHKTREIHDYSRKNGVVRSEIIVPDGAAGWLRNRERLWNAAERAEKRKDGVVGAKEILALPHELTAKSRLELALAYAKELVHRHGCVVDFAIHEPDNDGDDRNHHLHVQFTSRVAGPDGLGAKLTMQKDSAWGSRRDALTADRQLWEKLVNESLACAMLEIRIDCRTLREQRANPRPGVRLPSSNALPGKHLGPAASAIDRKAKRTHGRDVVVSEMGKAAADAKSKGMQGNSIFDALGIARAPKRGVKPLLVEYLAYKERAIEVSRRQLTAAKQAQRNLRDQHRYYRESLANIGAPYRTYRAMTSVLAAKQKAERADLRAALELEAEQARPKRFREWARGWSAEKRKFAAGWKRPPSIFDYLERVERPKLPVAAVQPVHQSRPLMRIDKAKADRWLKTHRESKFDRQISISDISPVVSLKAMKDATRKACGDRASSRKPEQVWQLGHLPPTAGLSQIVAALPLVPPSGLLGPRLDLCDDWHRILGDCRAARGILS